jgi:hypothetical protein
MREIEEELRKALQALRKELDQLLFPEEARRMDEILEQLSQHSRDPAICNQAMDQVMDLILKTLDRSAEVGGFIWRPRWWWERGIQSPRRRGSRPPPGHKSDLSNA